MHPASLRFLAALALAAALAFPARSAAPQSLLDAQVTPSSAQVVFTRGADGLTVNIRPGEEGYPGVTLTPPGKVWDLSVFGHVEALVKNLGAKPVSVCLRIDDDGDWQANPWNAENVYLKAGETGTVKVIFGHLFGFKPGYPLKPAAVTKMLLFAGKSKDSLQSFLVQSLVAAGPAGEKPPVDLKSLRTVPPAGVLLSAEAGVDMKTDAKDLTAVWSGTKTNGTLRLTLPPGRTEGRAALKPPVGRWNLRAGTELCATIRNDGKLPLTAAVAVESNGGPTESFTAKLPPGVRQEIVVPFAHKQLWDGNDKKSGTHFTSETASGVTLTLARESGEGEGEGSAVIESLVIAAPTVAMPGWLGKRPPADGKWKMTFQDEFDGMQVDTNKWSTYGENYWDKVSHFTKETTFVSGGLAHLRFEKKRGHHNDDPKRPESDYATGFLESFGKFTQRYGYFEARMKLPTAPGLWPAFWMMPDRGGTGPQWQRSDTKSGGMEFDIMEHLTRWGANRFNIAMHWDGYGKEHKSIGSTCVYFTPDKDGFVTSGLLWEPGLLVFYCQGREIGRWADERVASVPEDIMFTLPAGGWDNDWLDHAKLPDEFLIDYVRVWQRADRLTD